MIMKKKRAKQEDLIEVVRASSSEKNMTFLFVSCMNVRKVELDHLN